MKKILLFSASLSILFVLNITAQKNEISQELLMRYQNLEPNGKSPLHYFTQGEIETLQTYLGVDNQSNQSNSLGGSDDFYGAKNNTSEFVQFNTATSNTFTSIAASAPTTDFESSGDIDPMNLDTAYVLTLVTGEFFSVDITSGVYTSLGTIAPPTNEQWNGLEFDPSTGVLFGISSDFTATSTLSIINPTAMTANPVGVTGMPGAISIVITPTGDMYGYDVVDDNFYSINTTTAAATIIGPLGFNANFGQDMEYDNEANQVYMTAFNNDTFEGEFRSVNVASGASTLIGDLFTTDAGTQMAWCSAQNITLSIDDNILAQLKVYPIPASDRIFIESPNPVSSATIYSVLGKVISQHKDLMNNEINVSALTPGTYFLKLEVNGNAKTIKFSKK